MMLRRTMITNTGVLSAVGLLAACATPTAVSGSSTIPAQIIADAKGALQGLANVIPALIITVPPVLTAASAAPLTGLVQQGLSFIAGIGPDTAAQTGVTVLARVEGYISSVLAVLTVAPIPSPYSLIVIAADVIIPELEAYIASVVPAAAAPAKAAARVAGENMTLEQARQTLRIPASP